MLNFLEKIYDIKIRNTSLPTIRGYKIVILRTRTQETFRVDTASYCASQPRNLSLIVDYVSRFSSSASSV